MSKNSSQRRAAVHRDTAKIWFLRVLVTLGIGTIIYYYSWWTTSGRIRSPLLLVGLTLALLYTGLQVVGPWLFYLSARRYVAALPYPESCTVDVFVTAFHEPYKLVERTLAAAIDMQKAHRTWLLDDDSDPALEHLAARLGAGYLTRTGSKDAKAGNFNAALARTDGDIIVIFDADHAPLPDFLERTLGYFTDPRVGFVQVMVTFANGDQSWFSRAALETSLDFYNPVSLGMDRMRGATMMGSNALIRRAALGSIGGYQPGLAEDLWTSIALHAAGWQSAYVAQPLAPGLAPADLYAWSTQQLKWARGVFEVLLIQFPRSFASLTNAQRLSYAVRMTYYWVGPVIAIHLLLSFLILVAGSDYAQQNFSEYIVSLLPLAALVLVIRQVALRAWRHPSVAITLLWRAVVLIYATWPLYALAWGMALARIPLNFRLTPKVSTNRPAYHLVFPQVFSIVALASALSYSYIVRHLMPPAPFVLFVLGQMFIQVLFLLGWLKGAGHEVMPEPDHGYRLPPAEFSPAAVSARDLGTKKFEM